MSDQERFVNWTHLIGYPCVAYVYGPERTHRTTYRGENPGFYGYERCADHDALQDLVFKSRIQMPLSELDISAVWWEGDGGGLVTRTFS